MHDQKTEQVYLPTKQHNAGCSRIDSPRHRHSADGLRRLSLVFHPSLLKLNYQLRNLYFSVLSSETRWIQTTSPHHPLAAPPRKDPILFVVATILTSDLEKSNALFSLFKTSRRERPDPYYLHVSSRVPAGSATRIRLEATPREVLQHSPRHPPPHSPPHSAPFKAANRPTLFASSRSIGIEELCRRQRNPTRSTRATWCRSPCVRVLSHELRAVNPKTLPARMR